MHEIFKYPFIMKKVISFRFFWVILLIFTSGTILGQENFNANNFLKLGVSQVNITPDKPVRMAGYGVRTTPSTGVHDEIFASAFYFSGPKNDALIITADLCLISEELIGDLKKSISGKTGIYTENIMITVVHNHGGPFLGTDEKKVPESTAEYTRGLKEKLVNLAADASKKAVPFRMGIGKGSCNLNINRRAEFTNGRIEIGRNPDGPCDHDLVVVKFEDLNNKTLAIFLNWPCHATVSSGYNYQITGDWPGAAARYIKKNVSNDIVVGVTAGASGDINPIYTRDETFSEVEAVGYHVGKEACKTLDQITTLPVKMVQVQNAVMTFPGKVKSEPDPKVWLTSFKIGDLVLSGVSGELMTEMGMEVKKRSPYTETVIVAHCNGYSGYLCTDKAYTQGGGTEIKQAKFLPGLEKPLTNKFLEMIHSF